MRHIGIDVGKSRCQACIMDEDGGILNEFPFTNDAEGIHRLLELADTGPRLWWSPPATCGSGYTRP